MNREQEFRQLITSELPMLRRGIYRIVGNAADTDDVIQDAMLKAFLRFDSFKCKSALSTWVYRIAVNCAFDWMRRQKRQADALREYGEMMQAGASSPSDEGRFEALTQAIEKLPDNYREAIVWGCLSDLSGHDAAIRLGCNENTLYQRVHFAKKSLKRMLTQGGDDDE